MHIHLLWMSHTNQTTLLRILDHSIPLQLRYSLFLNHFELLLYWLFLNVQLSFDWLEMDLDSSIMVRAILMIWPMPHHSFLFVHQLQLYISMIVLILVVHIIWIWMKSESTGVSWINNPIRNQRIGWIKSFLSFLSSVSILSLESNLIH